MARLYVIGDSYSTPHSCVNPEDSFWGLAAVELGVEEIINVSRPRNTFDSICQLLIGMQHEYDYDWHNDWFLIGIPPLERITIFDDHKDTQYKAKILNPKNWNELDTTIQAHRGLITAQHYNNDKDIIINADRSWTETQVLREIFLLTQWLDANNSNYLICNLSKALDKNNRWGPSEFVLDYVINHPKCIVFENTYHGVNEGVNWPADGDLYGWWGHHGPEGNKRYYDISIQPKLQEQLDNQ